MKLPRSCVKANVLSTSLWSSSSLACPCKGIEQLASGSGNWLSHLDWDSERYWTLCAEQYDRWTPVQDPLPSDCRYREDLQLLKAGDLAGAQEAKEKLERLQRRDQKLRGAHDGR